MNGTPGPGSKARILIVDDHPLIRGGLVELVDRQPDMEVCGQAGSGREALEAVAALEPDLAVIDLALGDMDGMDLLRDIHLRHERTSLLVLSRHEETLFAERALRAGARGYVMKHEGLQTVLQALRQVLNGEVFLSQKMHARVLLNLVGGKRSDESPSSLSDRELQVFTMIGQGLGPSAIAKRLNLSVKTIDAHRARIKEKLRLGSAEEVRQAAIGWLRDHDES